MKPLLLRFRGLHSYRGWQEVDFSLLSGSGLFGIFGPTGAGKSTVPDAITLALYGQVERAARGTQGIINLAEDSCEVAFTFELGRQTYTVQRSFKRVKGDPFATESDKCRLIGENGGQVLADRPTDITSFIKDLLNMDMQRFCQTVILPQGKFDRFLRLRPGERGNMLEDIFHLQEYGEALRLKAKTLADKLEAQISLGEKELALLGDCAPAVITAAEQQLAVCQGRLKLAEETRGQAQSAWQAAEKLAAKELEKLELTQKLAALLAQEPRMVEEEDKLAAAERAATLAPLLSQVVTRFKEQQQQEQAAQTAQEAAVAARAEVRQAEEKVRAAQQALQQQLAEAEQAAAGAEADSERFAEAERQLQQQWQQADEALAETRRLNAAEQVAARLEPGHPCPVCGQLVAELPTARPIGDIEVAEKVREQAFTNWQQAGRQKEEASRRLSQTRRQQLALKDALAAAGASAELAALCGRASESEGRGAQSAAACESLRQDLAALRRQAIAAATERGFASADEARRALLNEEELSHLRVSAQSYRQDVHAVKEQLTQLAAQLAGFEAAALPGLRQKQAEAEQTWQTLLVEEAHQAKALLTLQKNSQRWQELQGELTEQAGRRDTARRLQTLVSGKAFVRFLARERLRELAAEASHTVGMLSGQKYQLQLFEAGEGSDFIIVDQYNGGQRRPVANLSGGEIFLVSLSLALALSRNIEMQGETLGFFFLDEGFGTLDADTLETVMGILERLPSGNRVVGLISHVAEVKARLPRYLEAAPADGEKGSVLKMINN